MPVVVGVTIQSACRFDAIPRQITATRDVISTITEDQHGLSDWLKVVFVEESI